MRGSTRADPESHAAEVRRQELTGEVKVIRAQVKGRYARPRVHAERAH